MQRNTLCVLSGSLRSLAALACAAALYIAGAPRAAEASGSIRCTAYDVPVTVAGVPSAR